MIGMSGEDGGCAVELFGKHDTGKLVRPGHAAESERVLGARREIGMMAVSAAEREDRLPVP